MVRWVEIGAAPISRAWQEGEKRKKRRPRWRTGVAPAAAAVLVLRPAVPTGDVTAVGFEQRLRPLGQTVLT